MLRDAESSTYGQADLLVRSDVLAELFPGSLEAEEASQPAPDLDAEPWHYVVVDIKFTILALQASGELGNAGSQACLHGPAVHLQQGVGAAYQTAIQYLISRILHCPTFAGC